MIDDEIIEDPIIEDPSDSVNTEEASRVLSKVPEVATAIGRGVVDAASAAGGFAVSVGKSAANAASNVAGAAKERAESMNEIQVKDLLDSLYQKSLDGIPMVSASVDELADDYLSHHSSPRRAAKALIRNQIIKCGTSGFITGLGGLITLPIAIPANVSSVMYVQMRMIAAIARIGGFDLHSDQVQTLVYVCLTGTAASDILKSSGIKVGEKVALGAIKKIPGKTLTAINQKVGFRFITKFGEKGVINLGKAVPVVGGVIGGGFDVATTRIIAANAFKMFIEKEMPE